MEGPTRVASQPGRELRVLVGGVLVEHDISGLAGRHGSFDGVVEADEVAVAGALHAAAEDGAFKNSEGGKQRRRSPESSAGRL